VQTRHFIFLRLEKRKTIAIRREEEIKETPPFSFESETDRETDTGGGKEKNKAGERSKSERDREVFARVPDDCFFFYEAND